MRKNFPTLFVSLSFTVFAAVCPAAKAADMNVADFGAKTDAANNAAAIQAAIDECAKSGGGIVHIPAGQFKTSAIRLKSRVHLQLNPAAVLKGTSPEKDADGKETGKWLNHYRGILLDAKKAEDISLSGGTIDGGGHPKAQGSGDMIAFHECRNVAVKDIVLKNGLTWTLHLVRCDGVTVRGVRMHTHGKQGNDGIDIESKNVVIADCQIQSDDDAICFKSPDKNYVVEHCTVSNCIIASNCNAVKFGTASDGGFRNISISNCVIRRATESPLWHWKKMYPHSVTEEITNLAGLALEVVDGGFMDQIVISNITMTGVQTPIFLRLGARKEPAGTLKNIVISGITATSDSLMASTIAGIPGHCIENVILRDILIHSPGGGEAKYAEQTPDENEKGYPENRMFGKISPAHGLYVRHVRNLTAENIQCYAAKKEERPAFRFDDVKNFSLRNEQATPPAGSQPLLKLIQSEAGEKR